MAPKKRSQTPRYQGVTDTQLSPEPVQTHHTPSQQPTDSITTTKDRRRRPKDTTVADPILPSSHSPVIADVPHSPVESITPGSHSRRESTSTMRTSSISLEGVPSCTPTGRISKAKKGKRVHSCEFPGCGKVSSPKRQTPNSRPTIFAPLDPEGRHPTNLLQQVFTRAEHRR